MGGPTHHLKGYISVMCELPYNGLYVLQFIHMYIQVVLVDKVHDVCKYVCLLLLMYCCLPPLLFRSKCSEQGQFHDSRTCFSECT